MDTLTKAPTYVWTAPSGVRISSCKPEVRQQGMLEHVLWSYQNWGKLIVKTQLTRLGFMKEPPPKQKLT